MKERIALIKGTNYRITDRGVIINKHGRPLVGYHTNGYHYVNLRVNKKTIAVNVAKAVLETFNGKMVEGLEIDHINGDRRDNSLANLRQVSHKENMMNPITRNRLSKPRKRCAIIYEKID